MQAAHRFLDEEQQASATPSASVIAAHYRLRPPEQTTTIRLIGDEIAKMEGLSSAAGEAPRALYLLESDDPDAVFELAARLPAVRIGGTVEIWPLIEPSPHARGRESVR